MYSTSDFLLLLVSRINWVPSTLFYILAGSWHFCIRHFVFWNTYVFQCSKHNSTENDKDLNNVSSVFCFIWCCLLISKSWPQNIAVSVLYWIQNHFVSADLCLNFFFAHAFCFEIKLMNLIIFQFWQCTIDSRVSQSCSERARAVNWNVLTRCLVKQRDCRSCGICSAWQIIKTSRQN